jgi:hypothetical protein
MSNRSVIIGVGCLLVLASLLAAALWFLPQFLLTDVRPDPDKPNDKIRIENELRTGMIQFAGGLFVAAGIFVGYRNLKALQDRHITTRQRGLDRASRWCFLPRATRA